MTPCLPPSHAPAHPPSSPRAHQQHMHHCVQAASCRRCTATCATGSPCTTTHAHTTHAHTASAHPQHTHLCRRQAAGGAHSEAPSPLKSMQIGMHLQPMQHKCTFTHAPVQAASCRRCTQRSTLPPEEHANRNAPAAHATQVHFHTCTRACRRQAAGGAHSEAPSPLKSMQIRMHLQPMQHKCTFTHAPVRAGGKLQEVHTAKHPPPEEHANRNAPAAHAT